MSFNITLYKNKGEVERLDKTAFLSGAISLNGTLREETSVIHPRIKIETNTNISTYNYASIGVFGRYYFIKNITSIRNTLWEIELECDVLMTYRDSIRLQQGIINKQESSPVNKYYNDGSFPTAEDNLILIKQFNNKLLNYDSNGDPIPVWMALITM